MSFFSSDSPRVFNFRTEVSKNLINTRMMVVVLSTVDVKRLLNVKKSKT